MQKSVQFSDFAFTITVEEVHNLVQDQEIAGVSEHRSVSLGSMGKAVIPNTWILLDSQSTVDVFANPTMLNDIMHVQSTLWIYT